MKNSSMKKISLGILFGIMAGYAYYYFIGCRTGSCALTGNPVNSTVYGAVVGLLWSLPYQKNRLDKGRSQK